MLGLGLGEILIIFGALVIIFGIKRIPELGDSFGKAIKNFKKGLKDTKDDL